MKKRPPGNVLAGADGLAIRKPSNTNHALPARKPQSSFQSIGALSQQVVSDLIRRQVSEPLEA
jgi:hypothetical protein